METSINVMNLVMGTLKVREGHCEDRPLGRWLVQALHEAETPIFRPPDVN